MRKRNNFVPIRMSDDEFARLKALVAETGQTRNSYILNSIFGAVITTTEYVAELKDMNNTLKNIYTQMRGMATNINQLAHTANITGYAAQQRTLEETKMEIQQAKKELNEVWQFIKALIRRHGVNRR